jgi:hypothetical protein
MKARTLELLCGNQLIHCHACWQSNYIKYTASCKLNRHVIKKHLTFHITEINTTESIRCENHINQPTTIIVESIYADFSFAQSKRCEEEWENTIAEEKERSQLSCDTVTCLAHSKTIVPYVLISAKNNIEFT